MKGFALTGVSGFVAPRHLRAIKDTGNNLLSCMDISDSAGVLDHYFPQADFFTDHNSFAHHVRHLSNEQKLQYLSVCTPNHLHHEQVRFGLQNGLEVICEKPLVLTADKAECLVAEERQTNKRIYNILQLRLHPQIVALKQKVAAAQHNTKWDVDLTYITARGKWYHKSWKGDESRSGGIATNIGIHFFDMLIWIFGPVEHHSVHIHTPEKAAGFIELQHARVRWFLSIKAEDLPLQSRQEGHHSFRSVAVDGGKIEFTTGFEDLHTKSYEAILAGQGFGLTEALPSIALAEDIRTKAIAKLNGDLHPFLISNYEQR